MVVKHKILKVYTTINLNILLNKLNNSYFNQKYLKFKLCFKIWQQCLVIHMLKREILNTDSVQCDIFCTT